VAYSVTSEGHVRVENVTKPEEECTTSKTEDITNCREVPYVNEIAL
jgi:hypothetical protein